MLWQCEEEAELARHCSSLCGLCQPSTKAQCLIGLRRKSRLLLQWAGSAGFESQLQKENITFNLQPQLARNGSSAPPNFALFQSIFYTSVKQVETPPAKLGHKLGVHNDHQEKGKFPFELI